MKLLTGHVALFQYGSNMSPSRLNSPERLNKRARRPVQARLEGWGIRFDLYSKCNGCGVTNIVEANGEYVMGVVYQVPVRLIYAPNGKRSKMDKIEGAQPDGTGNYKRQKIDVNVRGEKVSAVTYVGTQQGKRRFLDRPQPDRRVSRVYFGYLLSGAKKFGFPNAYISHLRQKAGALKD